MSSRMVSLHGRRRLDDNHRRRDLRLKYTPESHSRKRVKNCTDENRHGVRRRRKSIHALAAQLIPEDIMSLVVNKLDVVDFNRFSAVCKAWHSIANEFRSSRQFLRNPIIHYYPWLMFSLKPSEWKPEARAANGLVNPGSIHQHDLWFFSLSHGQIFSFSMPDAYGSRCCGSDSGWLIMVSNNINRCNFLWNPLTSLRIELPPQATLPSYLCEDIILRRAAEKSPTFIRKAMLLPTTSEAAADLANYNNYSNNYLADHDDLLVVAIYGEQSRSAFCKPRDGGAWTAIGNGRNYFEDFIFYRGKLYAITLECDLTLVDQLASNPTVTSCNIQPPEEEKEVGKNRLLKGVYLVECLGELLMVIKIGELYYPNVEDPIVKKFHIFKLDQQNRCWIKVEDLGHQILFVGTSTGFSLSTLNFPLFKGNCVYFGDEYSSSIFNWKACHDLGVYNLKTNTVERFFGNCHRSVLSSLIWFKPISWQ